MENMFETHTVTIYSVEKWNEFKNTDKYLAEWDGTLILTDELIEAIKKDVHKNPEEYRNVDLNSRESCIKYWTEGDYVDFYTYEKWGSSDHLLGWSKTFEAEFTTQSGDKMVAVGIYICN